LIDPCFDLPGLESILNARGPSELRTDWKRGYYAPAP
jgi:hypothetical protein